ncbi:MAG: isoprenylcysteine carboxylmethyltransferase family protein [Planctomycetota bacterium]
MRTYRLHQAVAFKLRGILMVPPILVLFLCLRWEWEYEPGLWAIGLLLFLPGMALRVWSQRHLRYRLRIEQQLATQGPYTCTRNPVYLGNMLILAGLCVLCELPWMIPLVCGWALLVYDCAIRFEETRLSKRYGDAFTAYCRTVNRWWPQLPATAGSPANRVAAWVRAASVEWHCLLFLIIPVLKELVH